MSKKTLFRSFYGVAAFLLSCLIPVAALSVQNGKIAFVSDRDGNFEIYVMNPDRTGQRRLTNHPDTDSNPAWSPDGNTISFARTSATIGGNGIFAIGSTGGPVFPLAVHSFWYAGFYDPSWSPDGQRLLFTVPSQGDIAPSDTIVSVPPNGTGYTNIYTGQHSVGGPKYSPDGQKIVFAETLPGPTLGIYQIRLLDRVLTDLSSNNLQPDWQPLRPGASISGKVTTPSGLGLRNVTVVLTDDSEFKRTAVTSSFGIYEFNEVQTGREYTVAATSKRYRFQARTVTLEANITGFDLAGLE